MENPLRGWAIGVVACVAVAAASGCAAQVTTEQPEVSESELTTMAAKIRALKTAVRKANVPANNDYGKTLAVTEYPRGTSVKKVLEDVTGTDESDIELSWFDLTWGASGVSGFASILDETADDALADGEDDEDTREAAEALKNVAKVARRTFFPVSQFTAVSTRSHSIAEDGDLESHTIIATKPDGSFLVLSYTNFPF